MDTDDQVQGERVVLAAGEALETIDHERLGARATGPVVLQRGQGLPAEPRNQSG